MNSQKYIVDTSFNWADEIDVGAFCILDQEEIDIYRSKANELDDSETLTYYCGTNEETDFSKEEILDMLDSARPISDAEAKIIEEFVPDGCLMDIFYELFDWDDEDEDESDDEDSDEDSDDELDDDSDDEDFDKDSSDEFDSSFKDEDKELREIDNFIA